MVKALGFAAALALITGPAHAAIVDFKVTGTIATSNDQSGVFGDAGSSLVNDSFLAEYIFDTIKGTRLNLSPDLDSLSYSQSLGEIDPLISAALTINGHIYSFNGLDSNDVFTARPQGSLFLDAFDQATRSQTFNASFIGTDITTPNAPTSLDTTFSTDGMNFAFTGVDSYQIAYQAGDAFVQSFGSFNVQHVESLVSGAPEPGVWALMIAGLGLVGVALRFGQRCRANLVLT